MFNQLALVSNSENSKSEYKVCGIYKLIEQKKARMALEANDQ